MKEKRHCINCGTVLVLRHKIKYCSNKCQIKNNYKIWIESWKIGNNNGSVGLSSGGISRHLRKFLIEKFGSKCAICGWNKKHPLTNTVPLEIDHIDGNAENNLENNLRLICPNCHALTPFFRNLNRGRGRKWRTEKYSTDLHRPINKRNN